MANLAASDAPLEMRSFNITKQLMNHGPRVAELVFPSRRMVKTPALVACASRGVLPHITPDLVQKHTAISVVYSGLEDFLEKSRQDAPILSVPDNELAERDSRLRAYTGLPDTCISILGPRRVPRLDTPHHNTNSALSISTSFGFATLEHADYDRATRKLRPDVSAAFVDLVQKDKISRKRIEKSADRTHAWLRDNLDAWERDKVNVPLFASIPPLEPEQQSFYLADLQDQYRERLAGLCVYNTFSAQVIPDSLRDLPVLCLDDVAGPHEILTAVSNGIDLVTCPFVTTTSEAGIALTFTFQPLGDGKDQPLGVDMWSTSHATDLGALQESCTCYTCTRHHRAYVHHLLQAKEMLAWTLLQIHNFHVVGQFFAAIQKSIIQGTFEDDSRAFRQAYDMDMPQKTGQGPRVRGYQIRSLGAGEAKKNSKAYNKLDEQALKLEEAEFGVAKPGMDDSAEVLEEQGLGAKIE